MYIRVGFEIAFIFPEPTSLVLMLSLHPSLDAPISSYSDIYGNRCSRVLVPAGRSSFFNDAIVEDDARATRTALEAYREKTGVCRDYMHLASIDWTPFIFAPRKSCSTARNVLDKLV